MTKSNFYHRVMLVKLMTKLKRLSFMKLSLIFITTTLTCCVHAESHPSNIIYILADDLGYGDLGCYGQEIIQTPHIDKLCEQGMKFTRHYSGSTVCAPSRSCFLNGKHTGHVYVRANGNYQMRPDPQDITIATLLKQVGYHTAMIGKSGTGCRTEPGHANQKGFDYFFGFNGHGEAHHYYPPVVYRNAEEFHFPNNHKHTGETYIHDVFLKEIMKYLEDQKEGPFFLHYAALIPHASIVAPEKWIAPYREKIQEASPYKGGHYAPCQEPKATFAGMVSRLDWEVGQIVKKVHDLRIAKNTLIIFSSDNGAHKAGGNKVEWFDSSGPLRGGKRDLYEGGIRVPMIAYWPEKIKGGSTTNHLSAFWDLMPTLCELTGAEYPKDTDGISFAPTLFGHSDQKQHDYLYWEFYEKGNKRAALTHKWKAVQLDLASGGDPIQLFDIAADISEKNDVAAQHPEVITEFERIFKEAHSPSSLKKLIGSENKKKRSVSSQSKDQ